VIGSSSAGSQLGDARAVIEQVHGPAAGLRSRGGHHRRRPDAENAGASAFADCCRTVIDLAEFDYGDVMRGVDRRPIIPFVSDNEPQSAPVPAPRAGSAAAAGSETWVNLRSALSHPLVYRKMVAQVDPRAKSGDWVVVFNRDGTVHGRGFWHAKSQLAVRLLSFGDRPATTEAVLRTLIADAVRLRREVLRLDETGDAWRVIHAEGDGLSGLIVDRFADHLVIELFSLAMFQRLELLKTILLEHFPGIKFQVRADVEIERLEGFRVKPPAPGAPKSVAQPPSAAIPAPRTVITENGVRFQVDFAGHKTGFFCDQRDNRRRLAQRSAGAEVIDVCSYSGGFGVNAAKGGAASVTCVDLDEAAIALVKRNANLNQVRVDAVHDDAFHYLRQMHINGRKFGVTVLDPSKFIPTREDFEDGRKKYYDLNKLGVLITKPGGLLLTCSCSGLLSPEDFHQMVRGAARTAGARVQVFESGGAAADHPVVTDCPESAYLKYLWCRVLPAL